MKTRRRTVLIEGSLEALHVLPARSQGLAEIEPACEGLVLPPYPGEMGIEIRYFLARVEPWFRAGWKILARRPEFYPEGSAICDDALTQAENALFARYGAVRLATGPNIVHPARGRLDGVAAVMARAKARRLQEEWRLLLRPFLGSSEGRPWTRWDSDLTTVSTAFSVHQLWKHGDAFPPTYQPPAFVSESPEHSFPAHVGVQLRAITYNPNGRNSDVATVMAEAQAVAMHLSQPLLVYGEPQGCFLPDGACTTASLGGGRVLNRELGYLRTCTVMLAPNSGWADLMCWLRVPVLVERTEPLGILDMMALFKPRVLLRQPELPVEAQVDDLLDGLTAFSGLGWGVVTDTSLDEWVAGR
jgi:hypothetical protein